jgi:DNA invertase Pin-like site-specific DNA recombinase
MDNLMLQLMGAFAQFEREDHFRAAKGRNKTRLAQGSTKVGA